MNYLIPIEVMADLEALGNSNKHLHIGGDTIEFYTMTDIKDILHLGQNNAYKLIHTKGFPSITIGKKILIPKDEFEKWVKHNIGNTICI